MFRAETYTLLDVLISLSFSVFTHLPLGSVGHCVGR